MKLFPWRMSLEYFNFLLKYLRLKLDCRHRIKLICRNINETMQIICQCIWKLFIGANHLFFIKNLSQCEGYAWPWLYCCCMCTLKLCIISQYNWSRAKRFAVTWIVAQVVTHDCVVSHSKCNDTRKAATLPLTKIVHEIQFDMTWKTDASLRLMNTETWKSFALKIS